MAKKAPAELEDTSKLPGDDSLAQGKAEDVLPDLTAQVAELTEKLAKSDKDGLALAEENEKLEAKLREAALSELSVLGQLQTANEAAKLPKKSKSHCEDSKGNKQSVVEVMHASELCEKVKYGVISQDALVGLLKPESK